MNYDLIAHTDIFEDFSVEGIRQIIACSGAFVKDYQKGQTVFQEDEKPEYIFLLLTGKVLVTKNYFSGRRTIFFEIHEKEVFGILIQHREEETYWYDASAVTDCRVLAIPWKFLFQICPKSCSYHSTLIKNMFTVQADSCVSQMKKLHILSGPTVEAKAAYLMFELADENGELDFKMNREELADFLGVTRPSLSRSLMNLKKDGYIDIYKSKAKILDYEGLEHICYK
ncbi:MAG: Crp/Fnr family transcriptional regulator [Lachnospiraceae bacterium]|nr:Crp/Fnr family transcriptional regulator [Lachnospiraceae bacterium]